MCWHAGDRQMHDWELTAHASFGSGVSTHRLKTKDTEVEHKVVHRVRGCTQGDAATVQSHPASHLQQVQFQEAEVQEADGVCHDRRHQHYADLLWSVRPQ